VGTIGLAFFKLQWDGNPTETYWRAVPPATARILVGWTDAATGKATGTDILPSPGKDASPLKKVYCCGNKTQLRCARCENACQ